MSKLARPSLAALALGASAGLASAQGADVTLHIPDATNVQTTTAHYLCGTMAIAVDYINAGTTSLAVLHLPTSTVVTVTVLSASGARYAGGQYIWWSTGPDADLYDLTQGENAAPVHCVPAPATASH